MPKSAPAAWAWASLAVCAATIPLLPGFAGSQVFYVRDLSILFWGRYLWLRHELQSGGFPLWDPYVAAGQSAVADALHQLFLLPALAVRLIGSDVVGFNLWIATPFPLAALGAWLFLRRRFAADASALGAIAFSVSGPIVSTGNFPNLSWSAAAIPWVLWAVDRVATRSVSEKCENPPSRLASPAKNGQSSQIIPSEARPIAVLALVTALQALAGEPVTLLATLVVGLAFAAMVILSPAAPGARRSRLMASVVLGLGLGLGVAAIQLVPLGQAAALSVRSGAIAKDAWSLHPLALVEMVSLHLFGDYFASQSLAATPWLPILNSGREPLLFSIYFGVPLLGVALFGLVSGGLSRWTVFWTGAGAASLLSAFGAYTPVYPFVRDHLPLLPSLRFPGKYLVIWSIAVAAGAAAGWEAMARRDQGRRFTRARFVAIGLPLTIGVLVWIAAGACMYLPTASASRLFELARSLHAADPVAAAVFMLRTLPHAASSLLLLSAVTAVLLFAASGVSPLNDSRRWVAANGAAPPGAEATPVTSAFCRAPRGPRRADFARWGGLGGAVRGQAPPASGLRESWIRRAPAAARTALFGLIVVNLAVNAWGVNPTFNPAYFAEPRWLSLTHEHPDSRFYVGGKTDGTLDASDLDSARAYMNPPGLSGSASRAALSGQANFEPSGWRSREMLSYDLAVLWPRNFATMSTRFFLSGRTERDLLLDRTGVRYRVLPRQQAGGRTPILQVPYLMESFLFDYGGDVAPRVTVVSKAEVVGDSGRQIEALFTGGWDSRSTAIIDREPAAAGDARLPVPPTATITTDSANRVVVQAGAGEAGGYVVLLDSFSDGWRATVDGHPATIVRANGLFRAVRLNPGPHVVEFLYRPRAFLVGAAVSTAALIMVLGLLAWPALANFKPPRAGTIATTPADLTTRSSLRRRRGCSRSCTKRHRTGGRAARRSIRRARPSGRGVCGRSSAARIPAAARRERLRASTC